MSSFKINQNKIFLNNSSFVKHDESVDDYIIQHNLDSNILESSLQSSNISKITSSDIYSQALKYKKFVNDELNKSKLKASSPSRKKDSTAEIFKESLGMLQIPLDPNQKNSTNVYNEETSFLRFEDIEKNNQEILNRVSKNISLPRLYNKYQILKEAYDGSKFYKSTQSQRSPPKNKMVFDLEVTYNKEIYQGINSKIKQEMDESFNNLKTNIIQNKKTMIKMPPIRSYPMVKMNKISYKTNKEIDDLETKDHHTTISASSKIKVEETTKKDQPKIAIFPIYWSFANIYTWKPEARESASFILDGHSGILYGGLGTKVMDDVIIIDFGEYFRRFNDSIYK